MSSSLIRATALVAFVLISAGANGQQRPVNDTGVISCTNESWAQVTCESVNATLPGQDAVFGRDAMAVAGSLNKVDAGRRGFDFTKIGNDGNVVPVSAVFGDEAGQFRCVRDNTTGLVWENYREIRAWRDPNPSTNGGFIGTENVGNTTDAFVAGANSASRCARSSWRLPTVRELLSISTFEATDRIWWGDYGILSNSPNAVWWTSQTNPAYPEHAFGVRIVTSFAGPNAVSRKIEGETNKTTEQWTRLVSSQ